MRAYKNDPALREAFLKEMDWHAEQDKIVRGTYGDNCTNGDFKGCFVGCAVHSLARINNAKLNTSSHQLVEDYLEIPVELVHFGDAIFESLSSSEKRISFAVGFGRAVQVGTDLSMVIPHFLYWTLTDNIKPTRYPRFQPFIDAVVAMYEEWTRTGVRPSDLADRAYRTDRADLAYRTYGADLADRAYLAYLAYGADRADLADLADRAYLAYRTYGADLASNKILELIRAAPITTENLKPTEV